MGIAKYFAAAAIGAAAVPMVVEECHNGVMAVFVMFAVAAFISYLIEFLADNY